MLVKALANTPNIAGLSEENSTILKFLYNRGIKNALDYERFFGVTQLEDPALIANIKEAAKELVKFIKQKKRIVIYGDYDADGILSSFILYDYIVNILGYKQVWVWLPNRFNDGYGLNKQNLVKIQKFADVVVTVDCGIRDKALIDEFKSSLDFIVIDHHLIPEYIPKVPVVHPELSNGKNVNKKMSAGVVVYKFVSYLNKYLFKTKLEMIQDHIVRYLEFAGTTLVTDVMPMINENRVLLQLAYKKLRKHSQVQNMDNHRFFNVMLQTLDKNVQQISYRDFGFLIGPRLNAVGRIMDPNIAFASVLQPDMHKIQILNKVNTYRQELVKSVNADSFDVYKSNKHVILGYAKDFSEGIIGLIAGNLTKRHNKMSFVCTDDIEGGIKCSIRGPKGSNVIQVLDYLQDKYQCFVKYGGHTQAAGLTLKSDINLQDFWNYLQTVPTEQFYFPEFKLVDDVITPAQLDINLLQKLEQFAPFGPQNEEYSLVLRGYIDSISITSSGKTLLKIQDMYDNKTIPVFAKSEVQIPEQKYVYILGKPWMNSNQEIIFFADQFVNNIEYVWSN